MKHWLSKTSVKALNSWALVPCALQSCAIFSFFLSSTNPGLHLEKKKIWYPSCTAPPPISSFSLRSSSNFAGGAQGGNRKMSFAYLSHVSLILITKKDPEMFGEKYWGRLKKCFADCAWQIYISAKNTIFALFEGIFTKNLNVYFRNFCLRTGDRETPPVKRPQRSFWPVIMVQLSAN